MKNALSLRTWSYGFLLPLVYLIVEFSFNHQLVQVLDETVSNDILSGLELWGRLISGFGLGILCYRILTFRMGNTLVGLLLTLGFGMVVMWNAQKALLDYLVDSANPEDKQASIALALIAPKAGEGSLQSLAGERIFLSSVDAADKNLLIAMFPAAALHVKNRDAQLAEWLGQAYGGFDSPQSTDQIANNAYKNLIVPPVVLGFSIFFALVNFGIVISFLIGQWKPEFRVLSLVVCFIIFVGLSVTHHNVLLDSQGYANSLRPELWHQKPALAMLVEWSLRATESWGDVSAFIHRYFLFDYHFRLPH